MGPLFRFLPVDEERLAVGESSKAVANGDLPSATATNAMSL
jgi:hypothetical protein